MPGNILNAQGYGIPVIIKDGEDFLSLTAMSKNCGYDPKDVIRNFLSNQDTLRFVVTRQIINDPSYLNRINSTIQLPDNCPKAVKVGGNSAPHPRYAKVARYVKSIVKSIKSDHDRVRAESLINDYGLTCLHIKRNGDNNMRGIYAHHDVALHFATWMDPIYGNFVNRDYQRLKRKEIEDLTRRSPNWNQNRRDAALWHRTLEDMIRSTIVPNMLNMSVLDEEALPDDELESMVNNIVAGMMIHISNCINIAVFGKTAQQWREENPGTKGNMRDYATEDELNLVSYLEYRMIDEVAENPQRRWRNIAKTIAKECRDSGIIGDLNEFKVSANVKVNEPVSYDAGTMTSLESMRQRFYTELAAGEVHKCDDGYFRNNEGYIVLAPKFK